MEDLKRLKKCIPEIGKILLVNLVSGLVLTGFLTLLRMISGVLLEVIDRPAFTSGDLPHLFRSWQGIAVTVVGIAVLFVYVAADLNVTVILSREILENRKTKLLQIIKQAFMNLKLLLCPSGIGIILFIAFIVPLTGGAFEISLTSSFRVPDFILSVIHAKPIFYIGYWLFLLAAIVVEILHAFTLHYINLDGKKPREALKAARKLLKENRKEFFLRMIPFVLLTVSAAVTVFLVFAAAPISLLLKVKMSRVAYRFLMLLFVGIGGIVLFLGGVFLKTAIHMELTALFEELGGDRVKTGAEKPSTTFLKRGIVVLLAVLVLAAIVMTARFDSCFPEFKDESFVIAHRGAGDLAGENTVEAVNVAHDIGADACEIDIHRTKDGEYILNHDADFKRLTGDPRTPQEMTVEEIKQLRMADGSRIATLDEILDAAKGKVHLYIELKGATADQQMVDDLYQKLVEKDMLRQCSMISLNYSVIEYAETTYPDTDTVYLLFFGFGDLARLKCDSLGLELESATQKNVQAAKNAGKRVDVWTCNTFTDLLAAVRSGADGVITDKPLLLKIIKLGIVILDDDFLRIIDAVLPNV